MNGHINCSSSKLMSTSLDVASEEIVKYLAENCYYAVRNYVVIWVMPFVFIITLIFSFVAAVILLIKLLYCILYITYFYNLNSLNINTTSLIEQSVRDRAVLTVLLQLLQYVSKDKLKERIPGEWHGILIRYDDEAS